MANIKVDKHYKLDSELINEIAKKTKTKFSNQTEAIEYYLRLGLEYESKNNNQHTIESKLSNCQSEIIVIKRLLMQIFANSNFAKNESVKDCNLLYDMFRKYQKSDFSD